MMGAGYVGGYRPSRATTLEVKEKFAWLPMKTTSGKWIWRRKYIKRARLFWGPSGEGPVTEAEYFTEEEYTMWLLANDMLNSGSGKISKQ